MKMFGAMQPSEMGEIVAQVCDGGSVQYLVPAPPAQQEAPLLDALLSDPPEGGWDTEGNYHFGSTGTHTRKRRTKGEPIDLPEYGRIMAEIQHGRAEAQRASHRD